MTILSVVWYRGTSSFFYFASTFGLFLLHTNVFLVIQFKTLAELFFDTNLSFFVVSVSALVLMSVFTLTRFSFVLVMMCVVWLMGLAVLFARVVILLLGLRVVCVVFVVYVVFVVLMIPSTLITGC